MNHSLLFSKVIVLGVVLSLTNTAHAQVDPRELITTEQVESLATHFQIPTYKCACMVNSYNRQWASVELSGHGTYAQLERECRSHEGTWMPIKTGTRRPEVTSYTQLIACGPQVFDKGTMIELPGATNNAEYAAASANAMMTEINRKFDSLSQTNDELRSQIGVLKRDVVNADRKAGEAVNNIPPRIDNRPSDWIEHGIYTPAQAEFQKQLDREELDRKARMGGGHQP